MTADVQTVIGLLQPLKQQGLSALQAAQSVLSSSSSTAPTTTRALAAGTTDSASLGDLIGSVLMAQALVVVYDPLTPAELAVILRETYPDLSAVDIGRNILAPDVFPDTTPAVMQNALSTAGFDDNTVADAVNVLYPITVTVQSNQPWQDTGLNVTGRQTTQLSASGTWTANPATGMVGPNGNPNYIAKPGYTLPGAVEGALIGRVGNNAPFLVGGSAQAPAGQSGSLQLCINDDLNAIYGVGLADNIGTLQVSIVTS